MMAVNTKGLCATIALICVIMPMIIGHCMPTGTEERTVYESGNAVNITSDLVNNSEIAYSEDRSDYNNMPFLSATPVSVSSNYTTIPAFNAAFFQVYSPLTFDVTGGGGYAMHHYYFNNDPENRTFTFTYGGTNYTVKEIYYIKDRSLMVAYGDNGAVTIHDNFPTVTASAQYAGFSYQILSNPKEYINPEEGAYTAVFSGSEVKAPTFSNGFLNSRVGFNIELLKTNTHSQVYSVYDETTKVDITLTYNGGWTVSNGTDSAVIGAFKQIYLDLDAKNNEVRVSTLVRSDMTANPYQRIIKTYTIPLSTGTPLNGIDMVSLGSTTVQKAARIYCYSADVPTGKQLLITDNTLDLANYYPDTSVFLKISGNAFYGGSMTLPVVGSLTVTDGQITFTDLDGIERTVRIRDSIIAATYDSETHLYEVNMNGYKFAQNVAAADLQITFGGTWLFNASVSPVTPRTSEEYVFDFTTLNITMQEYAFIGLITAVLAFVACALIGKRSGTKVLSMLLVSGLAGMIYIGMLL